MEEIDRRAERARLVYKVEYFHKYNHGAFIIFILVALSVRVGLMWFIQLLSVGVASVLLQMWWVYGYYKYYEEYR